MTMEKNTNKLFEQFRAEYKPQDTPVIKVMKKYIELNLTYNLQSTVTLIIGEKQLTKNTVSTDQKSLIKFDSISLY